MNTTFEVKQVPELYFATISHIGKEGLQNTFTKLMSWAGPKGLLADPNFKMGTIFYDSFKTTPANKVRMKVCLLVDKEMQLEGEIEGLTLVPQKCIVAHFEIGMHEFEKAWTSVFIWMNEKGYLKADKQPFEIYLNNFNEHPEKKCIVDMYVPIQ